MAVLHATIVQDMGAIGNVTHSKISAPLDLIFELVHGTMGI